MPRKTPDPRQMPTRHGSGAPSKRSGTRGRPGTSLVGRVFGNVRIEERLGAGGMGDVYRGFDTKLERPVAVKTLRDGWFANDTARERFLREARILSRLDHPDICRIHDYVEEGPVHLLVLELVEGETLEKARPGDSEEENRLEIAEQLAEVLAAAHAAGIVHRDLKPANVMLTPEGRIKVLDFGIARELERGIGPDTVETVRPARGALADFEDPEDLGATPATLPGSVLGTPFYMSPEQARGEPVTPASDLYAYGLMLRELLTGCPSRPRDVPLVRLLEEAAEAEPLPEEDLEGVDRELVRLIEALLAPEPGARPTATETVRRIRWIRDRPRRRRRRAVVAAVVLAFVLGAVRYTLDLREERNRAVAARQEAEEVAEFLVSVFEVSDPDTARGATVTARELLDQGAERVRLDLADQPAVQARLEGTIGTIYRKLGLLDASLDLLARSVATRRGLEAPLELATSLNELGEAAWERGRYPRAEAALREALELREEALGPDDPRVADVLDNLGSVLEIQGRYEEAEPLLERALQIRELRFGPRSIEAAASLDDLAVLYFDQNDPERAEPLAREALSIRREVLGTDHPEVATSANSLGIALASQDRFDDAETLLREALEIRRRVLGPEHPGVAQLLNNLGLIEDLRGEDATAEVLLLEALEIWKATVGPTHLSTAMTERNLAMIELDRGDRESAEERLRRALPVYESLRGSEDRELAPILAALGRIARDEQRLSEARSLFERAVRIERLTEEPDDPGRVALEEELAELADES